jgi:hypothetical protein
MSAIWGEDYVRDSRLDRYFDEPGPRELEQEAVAQEAWQREVASRPVGTSIVAKKAA